MVFNLVFFIFDSAKLYTSKLLSKNFVFFRYKFFVAFLAWNFCIDNFGLQLVCQNKNSV